MSGDVLIVGAAAGGLTVAEVLRRKGFTGRIRLVDEEVHPPYDRPPLSKEILTGAWQPDRALLRNREQLDGLDAGLLLGHRAQRLDPAERTVKLDDGQTLGFETLVIATGVTPRRLDCQRDLAGVFTFRTLDDAMALRRELAGPADGTTAPDVRRVAIVGAGVLGCEIAAAARGFGHEVTLVEPGPVPMERQLGHRFGGHVAATHRDRGVDLRTGVGVTALLGTDRVSGLALSDGSVVATDLAVVTAGSVPATGWLTDSGLGLADGVECDEYGRAAPGIYAVGDVARWRHPGTGVSSRVETRTNAGEQAMTVASNILGDNRYLNSVPYFWSDQYDTKIQMFGTVTPHSHIRVIDGAVADGRFVALAETGDNVTAAIGWNNPRGTRTARAQLTVT